MQSQILIFHNGAFVDAHATWGITAGQGFADALCAPASLKDFVTNSSRLEDGTHIIVGNPKIASREITLIFQIKGENSADFQTKKANFVAKLQQGEIILQVPSLGNEIYRLVYTKGASYAQSKHGAFCKMGCKFVEPNPNDRGALD